MRNIIIILFFLISTNIFAINKVELNKEYNHLLVKYKNNKVFIRHLKESQKQWEAYVKSQLNLVFDSSNDTFRGSYQLCLNNYYDNLIRLRVDELKELENMEEYNVCVFDYSNQT